MSIDTTYTESDLARIRWRCHRGMLELDLFLLHYFDNCFADLTNNEKAAFEELLDAEDPTMFSWILGSQSPPEQHIHIVKLLQQYHATAHR